MVDNANNNEIHECPNCGYNFSQSDKVCPYCGTSNVNFKGLQGPKKNVVKNQPIKINEMEAKGFNVVIFILLFVFFWPAAIIYAVVTATK